MYELYCMWADEFEKPVLSKEQLGRRLNCKIKYLVPKKDSERFWANGKMKDKWRNKMDLRGNLDTIDTLQPILYGVLSNDKNDKHRIQDITEMKVSKPPKKIDNSRPNIEVVKM